MRPELRPILIAQATPSASDRTAPTTPAAPPRTEAITLQPLPLPREAPQISVSTETAGGLGVIVSALVGGIMYMRRRASRDGVRIVEDRTEGTLLKTTLTERNQATADAREAWLRSSADAREIGRLTAENEYLKRELQDARDTITKIRMSVQAVGRNVDTVQKNLDLTFENVRTGQTDFGPLATVHAPLFPLPPATPVPLNPKDKP